MPVLQSSDISTFIKLNTDVPGIGLKSWDDLFPPNEVLVLSDTNPIMMRVFEAYQDVPPDPKLERLLDNIGQWRIRTEIDLDSPFLEPTDPSRQHPAGPGPVDPNTLPPGIKPYLVGGSLVALNPPPDWRGNGPRGFLKKQETIRTAGWNVTGGQVMFKLHEGSSVEGPWRPVDAFSLQPKQVHNKQYKRSSYVSDHWWLLTVKATHSVEFMAPPFAY